MLKKTGKYILFLSLMFLAGSACAQGVQVSMTASVRQAQVGDQFNLQVQVQGTQNAGRPVIPAVDGLEIYYGGSSSSYQLMNGRMSASKTYNYTVLAKKAGDHTIQGVQVPVDGTNYTADPIQVKVVDAPGQTPQTGDPSTEENVRDTQSEALFMKAIPESAAVYENQQLVLQYILYRDPRVRLSNRISFENMSSTLFQGFLQEDVQTQPNSIGTRNIDGKQYEAILLKTVILFPIKPGTITIDPVQLLCQVSVPRQQRSRRSGPNDFFGDSFFDDFFGNNWQNVRIASNPVTVTVLPLPHQGRPGDFSGAVGQFQLAAQVKEKDIQEGQPLTLQVQLHGSGNLRVMDDPKLPSLDGFEQFEGTRQENINPNDQGLSGTINYEYVLIPRDPNITGIGPLEFTYFDPEQKTYKKLRTNPIPLVVRPSDKKEEDATVYRGAMGGEGGRQDLALANEDFRHIATDVREVKGQGGLLYRSTGFLAAVSVPWFIVLGTFIVRKRNEKLASDPIGTKRRRAYSTAIRELSLLEQQDTGDNDKIARTEEVIHRFLSHKFNFESRGQTIDQLADRLAASEVSPENVSTICELLRDLEDARYAPGSSSRSAEMITKTKETLGRFS